MTPVLQVRGLIKHYGPSTVLDGIDLDVAEHQVITLIGASGSGKSTLLRCVDLLEDIDDGQIFLDGVDRAQHRDQAAVLLQRHEVVQQRWQHPADGLRQHHQP